MNRGGAMSLVLASVLYLAGLSRLEWFVAASLHGGALSERASPMKAFRSNLRSATHRT
jgi:hypothetical protein